LSEKQTVFNSELRKMETNCSEKDNLLLEHENATVEYAKLVAALKAGIGILTQEDTEQIRIDVEEKRLRCEAASTDLEDHLWEHGCTP